MKVKDIVAAIEEFAPASYQSDFDNTGLQVGSPEQEVHGVLGGFDCTVELVQEAVEKGCDMIVTHHPLIYHPIKKLDPADPTAAAVIAAVKAGVAVYSAHTSADKVPAGHLNPPCYKHLSYKTFLLRLLIYSSLHRPRRFRLEQHRYTLLQD